MNRVMVSADLMEILADVATDLMKQDGGIHGRDWIKQVTTSRESQAAGGEITLRTNHDWPVAFMIWYRGRPEDIRRMPRGHE